MTPPQVASISMPHGPVHETLSVPGAPIVPPSEPLIARMQPLPRRRDGAWSGTLSSTVQVAFATVVIFSAIRYLVYMYDSL